VQGDGGVNVQTEKVRAVALNQDENAGDHNQGGVIKNGTID